MIMTATTLGQITINNKLRRKIQIIARSTFDLTGNSAAMRLPGQENLLVPLPEAPQFGQIKSCAPEI